MGKIRRIKNISQITKTHFGRPIASNNQYDMSDYEINGYLADSDFITNIQNGTIVINNGTNDITNPDDAINWLSDSDGLQGTNAGLTTTFLFDNDRNKNLSIETITVSASRNGVASGYIRVHEGIVMSNTLGYVFPWNATIVGFTVAQSDTSTGTIKIRINGYDTAEVLTMNNYTGILSTCNTDIDAGDVLSFYISSGWLNHPVVNAFIKWRK